ncbi:MAG TPA: hypothetical protein VEH48_00640 [Candidatus Nitrosopolaris sp.]|nr:hypothetical protein [Candidatus Nitrosopolaris sp.]
MSFLDELAKAAHKIVWAAAIEALQSGETKIARFEIQVDAGSDTLPEALSLTESIYGIYTHDYEAFILSPSRLMAYVLKSIATGASMYMQDEEDVFDGAHPRASLELVRLAIELAKIEHQKTIA